MTTQTVEKEETKQESKPEETISEELDLGIEKPAEEEEPELDYEAAYTKLKPDFAAVVKLFGLQPEAKDQEELATKLTAYQTEFEKYLKDNLVPKVKAALGLANASSDNKGKAQQKPGIKPSNQTQQRKRITTPRRGTK